MAGGIQLGKIPQPVRAETLLDLVPAGKLNGIAQLVAEGTAQQAATDAGSEVGSHHSSLSVPITGWAGRTGLQQASRKLFSKHSAFSQHQVKRCSRFVIGRRSSTGPRR
jgi:hypothetical protein